MASRTPRKAKDTHTVEDAETRAAAHRGETTPDRAAGPVPRGEPASTYLVDSEGEVRAGPGDAGRQDVPERLPDAPDEASRSTRRMLIVLAIAVVLMALIYLFAL